VQVKLVRHLTDVPKPASVCYFYERGARYHAPLSGPAGPPLPGLPLSVGAGPLGVVLSLNIGAYKNLETAEARRVAGAATYQHGVKAGGAQTCWVLDGDVDTGAFEQMLTGALLAAYRFGAYQSKPSVPEMKRRLWIIAGANLARFRGTLKRQQTINDGVSLARDLANTPANDLAPLDLAERARALAEVVGLECVVLSGRQLSPQRFAGLSAVGRGSANPPALITLTYMPSGQRQGRKPLCLVGKGLTFDSGGIDIKPYEGMWDMKADMSGAAAVLGSMQAVARLGLPLPMTGVIAAAENMPGGRAYRPGDVLRYANGRTVEIRSTDAEGRLVLADALLYAQRTMQQDRIVEFSTLTGACLRALGHQYIGLMSQSESLKEQVKQAGVDSGEPVWELPLHPEYRSLLDSSVADVRNVGGPNAGASTAAMFLHEFIDEGTEYVHLDIAGVFLAEREEKYWSQPGATGAGVRLACALAQKLA